MGHQVVCVADVVALYEVHTPVGVHAYDGVVVGLAARAVPHPVHIRVPPADRAGVGHHVGGLVVAQYLHVAVGGGPGDAPHDVYAEFQPQAVDIGRERPEALAALRGGETLRVRLEPGPGVYLYVAEGNVLETPAHTAGVFCVPLDVDYHVLPAPLLQTLGHDPGVGPDLLLIYSGVVVVVAVPPHRRGKGDFLACHSHILPKLYHCHDDTFWIL